MASRLVGGALAAALVVGGSVASCSSIPNAGPVRVVRHVPLEGPDLPEARIIRRVPSDPRPNAAPEEILRGFLSAQADTTNDHAIARKYLAPGVPWNPAARVTVYGNPRVGGAVRKGATATVTARVDPAGTIVSGEFRPAASAASTPLSFALRRVAGLGWRLGAVRPGVLLTHDEVESLYQRVTLYWPDQVRRLVPDNVFLPQSDQPITTVVRALLAGPKGWIAPAVRSAIPDGTELLEPPTFVDGVVSLNFSREIHRAPQETLGTLVAQVVWTLTESSLGVRSVHVSAEGDAITVAGRPQKEQRRTDWADFAPAPAPADGRLFFVRDGAAYGLDDAGRVARVGGATPPVESVAVDPSGKYVAVVTRRSGGHQSLLLMSASEPSAPRTLLTAGRMTAPSWEPTGTALWVVTSTNGTEQALVVPVVPSGAGQSVAVPVHGPVSSLQLSPDGARALLVAGSGAHATVWVARVERPAQGGPSLDAARPLVPSVVGVTAASYDGAGQVTFASLSSSGRPLLYRADIDGYDLVRLRDDGLPATRVDAIGVTAPDAAGALVDRVVSVAGRLWRRTPGSSWAALPGRGTAGTYAP